MPTLDGIKVELVSNSVPYLEYYDTDDDADNDNTTSSCYIEVVSGSRFTIRIVIVAGFNKFGADSLSYHTTLDGVKSPLSSNNEIKLQGETTISDIKFTEKEWINVYSPESKKWSKQKMAFSSVNIVQHRPDMVSQASQLGSITVTVRRGTVAPRKVARPLPGRTMKLMDGVSEKMLKGRAIYKQVALVDSVDIEPPISHHEFTPLPGTPGQTFTFRFLYRSRDALQTLGLIPRSPTPELSAEEQIRRLQERVKELERTSHDAIKAETETSRRIKRQRDDDDDDKDAVVWLKTKSRRIEDIETIDLLD